VSDSAASSPNAQLVVGPLVDRLRVARGEAAQLNAWVQGVATEPDALVVGLLKHLGERRGTSTESSPGRLEAYQDLVVGQLARRKPILIERTPAGEKSIGTADLHLRASRLAATWSDAGVGPGAAIAFVIAPGIEATVALLAALRIGATITWIAPRGKTYILDRLIVLEPHFIVAAPSLLGLLDHFAQLALPLAPTRGAGDGPSRGFSYTGADFVLRLYSPYARQPFDLFELTGAEVLPALLRGGFFGIAGDANDVLAWPELDDATHEPLITLAALLMGVTRVFCKAADLVVHPEWFTLDKVTLVGLGPVLREFFLREGPEVAPSIRAWMRDMAEPEDYFRTRALEQRVEPAHWRRTDLLHVAAGAGLLAFGAHGSPPEQAVAIIAPGLPWMLLDTSGTGKRATGSIGLFARARTPDDPDPAASCFALAKQSDDWVVSGSTTRGRWGRTYPRFEACAVAKSLPFVEEVDVIVRATGTNDAVVEMIIFANPAIGPVNRHRGAWTKSLRELLTFELGEEYVPDTFVMVPVRPRYTDTGEFDSSWLENEWLSGALEQKANDPMFVLFARLARIFAPPREG
jgi:hypothetical protein